MVLACGILLVGANVGAPIGHVINRGRGTVLGGATGALLLLYFFYCVPFGSAPNAAERARCTNNLVLLYVNIVEYIETEGGLPTDPDGSFSLGALLEDQGDVLKKTSLSPCRDTDVTNCYLVGHGVSPQMLEPNPITPPPVLFCDRPGNHILRYDFGLCQRKKGRIQEQACILLADGNVYYWSGDSTEYKAWAASFVKGVGPTYPPGLEQRIRRDYAEANVTTEP